MRYGIVPGQGDCEDSDYPNEGVHLQYSTNNGGNWSDINYWTPFSSLAQQQASPLYNTWDTYSENVPPVAATTNTTFRWAQLQTSNAGYDTWGIDEVEIKCPDPNVVVNWAHGPTVFNPPAVYPTSDTWYYVTITDTINYIFATDSVFVQVNPIPSSDFTISDMDICEYEIVDITYTGSASPGAIYTWNFGTGADVISGTGQGPYQVSWPSNSTQTVTLTVIENACQSALTSFDVTVNKNPIISFDVDYFSGCEPMTLNFSDNSTPSTISNWTWNFGDGNTSSNGSPSHTYTDDGVYDISLAVTTTAGCSNILSIPGLITIHPRPIADFTTDPSPPVVTIDDASFDFFDNTQGNPTSWQWDFADGSAINHDQNPTHLYENEGEYDVTLVVTSDQGCESSFTKKVRVIVDEIIIPNVFTPNGDPVNEFFFIKNIDRIESSNLAVYNRWGKKVYEAENYKNNWNGDDLPDGTYFYVLKYKTYFRSEEVSGTVTIIR